MQRDAAVDAFSYSQIRAGGPGVDKFVMPHGMRQGGWPPSAPGVPIVPTHSPCEPPRLCEAAQRRSSVLIILRDGSCSLCGRDSLRPISISGATRHVLMALFAAQSPCAVPCIAVQIMSHMHATQGAQATRIWRTCDGRRRRRAYLGTRPPRCRSTAAVRSDIAFAVSCHAPLQLMISAMQCLSTCAMRVLPCSPCATSSMGFGLAMVIYVVLVSSRSFQ